MEQIRDKVPICISHVASHRNASDVGKFGVLPNWGEGYHVSKLLSKHNGKESGRWRNGRVGGNLGNSLGNYALCMPAPRERYEIEGKGREGKGLTDSKWELK